MATWGLIYYIGEWVIRVVMLIYVPQLTQPRAGVAAHDFSVALAGIAFVCPHRAALFPKRRAAQAQGW